MKIVASCVCMYLVGARVSFEALNKNCLQNYMHAKKEEEEEEEVGLFVGGRIEDFFLSLPSITCLCASYIVLVLVLSSSYPMPIQKLDTFIVISKPRYNNGPSD